jgi:hypothetical protein
VARVQAFQIEAMTLADDIMNEVRKRPGLTVTEITMSIFGRRHPYTRQVNYRCRRLVDAGRLERRARALPVILSPTICPALLDGNAQHL